MVGCLIKHSLVIASYLWRFAGSVPWWGFLSEPLCSSEGWLCLTLQGGWEHAGHSASAQWSGSWRWTPVDTEKTWNSFRDRKITQTSLHMIQLHTWNPIWIQSGLSVTVEHIFITYNAVICGKVVQGSTAGFLCFVLLARFKQRQVTLQRFGVDQPTCLCGLGVLNEWKVKMLLRWKKRHIMTPISFTLRSHINLKNCIKVSLRKIDAEAWHELDLVLKVAPFVLSSQSDNPCVTVTRCLWQPELIRTAIMLVY